MFSLFCGLWEVLTRKEELHVLILGVDKAGKTTLLERLKSLFTDLPGLDPDQILPTVGLNVGRMDAFKAPLIFWDLGGQAGLRSIWDKYYKESHAVVFVLDSCEPSRFAEARDALERVLSNSELHGAPVLLAANKQDKATACKPHEVQEYFGDTGAKAGGGRAFRVQPMSALSGEGVRDGVSWIVEEIRRSHRTQALRQRVAR